MDSMSLVTEAGPLDLPPGWRADAVAGGVNVRVVSSGRKYIVAVAGIFAVLAGWRTISHWKSASAMPWLVVTAILTALALWCAFGDEFWHLERNCLVHQIGIRRWGFSRRYQDANLEIVQRFTDQGRPYYRLYAISKGKPFFLFERGEQELFQLAKFIAGYTNWQIRAYGLPAPDSANSD